MLDNMSWAVSPMAASQLYVLLQGVQLIPVTTRNCRSHSGLEDCPLVAEVLQQSAILKVHRQQNEDEDEPNQPLETAR